MLRKLLIGSGVLMLVLAVVIVVSEATGWRYLRWPIEQAANHFGERRLVIGTPFRLHLFRPEASVQAQSLYLAAPRWSEAEHFVRSGPVEASLRWVSLVSPPIRVPLLRARGLDIIAERDDKGRSSWDFGAVAAGHGRETGEKGEKGGGFGIPVIDVIDIDDSRLRYDDAVLEASADATLRMQSEGEERGGRLIADGTGKWRKAPIRFSAEVPGALAAAKDGVLEGLKADVAVGETHLALNGNVLDPAGMNKLDGHFVLQGPSIGDLSALPGLSLPETPPYRVEGSVSRVDRVTRLQIGEASIGRSRIGADLSYEEAATPPRLTGRMFGSALRLQDLGPAIGSTPDGGDDLADKAQFETPKKVAPPAPAPPPPRKLPGAMRGPDMAAVSPRGGLQTSQGRRAGNRQRAGAGGKSVDARSAKGGAGGGKGGKGPDDDDARVIPQRPLNVSLMKTMDADVQVDLKHLELGTGALSQLDDLKARLQLKDGVLNVRPLSLRAADGSIAGGIEFGAPGSGDGPPHLRAELAWRSLDLRKWVSANESRPIIDGRLSGNARVSGRGASTADMLGTLDGRISMRIEAGSLSHTIIEVAGLDVAQALGVFVAGDRTIPLNCALFDWNAEHGVLQTRAGLLDTEDTAIFVTGDIGLRRESLDLRMTPMPKDWSPLALRTPVSVGGTFGSPVITLEAKPLLLKAAAAVGLAMINPLAAILPFIDLGEKVEDGLCGRTIADLRRQRRLGGGAHSVEGGPAMPDNSDGKVRSTSGRTPTRKRTPVRPTPGSSAPGAAPGAQRR